MYHCELFSTLENTFRVYPCQHPLGSDGSGYTWLFNLTVEIVCTTFLPRLPSSAVHTSTTRIRSHPRRGVVRGRHSPVTSDELTGRLLFRLPPLDRQKCPTDHTNECPRGAKYGGCTFANIETGRYRMAFPSRRQRSRERLYQKCSESTSPKQSV